MADLGSLLSDIIQGKEPKKELKTKPDSADEAQVTKDGVVNIEKLEKAKKRKAKQEKKRKQEGLSDDSDSDPEREGKPDSKSLGKKSTQRKREWEMIARTFPNNNDEAELAKEKRLKRTARKGVVQLFNAVREHQNSLRRRQKGGNIQQRTTRVDETKESFNHLLEKRRRPEEETRALESESKWAALNGDSAGEEEDWMD